MTVSLPSSFIGSFLTFVLVYKYVALFGIAFTAAFLVPIPASTTLTAAAAFASQRYLNIYAVLSVALAGNICGDWLGYILARRYGEELLIKIGFRRILNSKKYKSVQEYILDFPYTVIYFSRFLTEIGPAVNILSGLAKVPYKTYLIFEVLGESSYVLLFGLAGYYLGGQWENNLAFITKSGLTMFGIGCTIYLIQLLIYKKRKK